MILAKVLHLPDGLPNAIEILNGMEVLVFLKSLIGDFGDECSLCIGDTGILVGIPPGHGILLDRVVDEDQTIDASAHLTCLECGAFVEVLAIFISTTEFFGGFGIDTCAAAEYPHLFGSFTLDTLSSLQAANMAIVQNKDTKLSFFILKSSEIHK